MATFFACLVLPLEIGVLIGIGLNLVSILYHAARPKLLIEVHKVGKFVESDKISQLASEHLKSTRFYFLDEGRHQLSDGHAGSVLSFSVGRLRAKSGDETQFEEGIARGHRLFAHLRRRLYRGKGSLLSL